MYRNQEKSFVKIRAPLATQFSLAKKLGGPSGPKSEFMGLRYCTKRAKIWFGLVMIIHAPFVSILSFALLKPCGLASRFEYNKHKFEDNFCLALRGHRDFLHVKMG